MKDRLKINSRKIDAELNCLRKFTFMDTMTQSVRWSIPGESFALIERFRKIGKITVPTQFMVPGEYEFEVLAIETSGSTT